MYYILIVEIFVTRTVEPLVNNYVCLWPSPTVNPITCYLPPNPRPNAFQHATIKPSRLSSLSCPYWKQKEQFARPNINLEKCKCVNYSSLALLFNTRSGRSSDLYYNISWYSIRLKRGISYGEINGL